MSAGLVICSACSREVHQYPRSGWCHCEDQTARCEGAQSIYPTREQPPVGPICRADEWLP